MTIYLNANGDGFTVGHFQGAHAHELSQLEKEASECETHDEVLAFLDAHGEEENF